MVLTTGLVLASVTASATTAFAAPAMAVASGPLLPTRPINCSSYVGGPLGPVICHLGGGEHRAKVRCDRSGWFDYDAYGPWKPNGAWSQGFCETDDRAKSVTLETRVWV